MTKKRDRPLQGPASFKTETVLASDFFRKMSISFQSALHERVKARLKTHFSKQATIKFTLWKLHVNTQRVPTGFR